MANRPATIRKADIERTVKGVLASGLAIARVEIEGGKIVVFTGEGEAVESPLEAWRRNNGAR